MGSRIVSIWFPNLATDWHARKQPDLRSVPFVLKSAAHNRLVVTAACPRAQARGIRAGMPLADARALLPTLHVIDDKPGLVTQLLDRIAEWCVRFTPVAVADPPAGIFLDATGCTHLWKGDEAYVADLRQRLSIRGYTVRAAMADTAGAAWAMARYGTGEITPPGRHRQALMTLPVAALRLDDDTVARLNKLGLRQVSALAHMPRTALRRRFGTGLLLRLGQAFGEEDEILTPPCPPEPWSCRLPCPSPIMTRTGIEIALEHLLTELCTRLQAEGKGLREASFRIHRAGGGVQGIAISTSRATHNRDHLFHLFGLQVGTLAPRDGIELFTLDATTVEEQQAEQDALWAARTGLQDPQVATLVDRLVAKLGPGVVHRYLPAERYWPELSYRPAPSLEAEPTTSWMLDRPRPLHLLDPPERIEVTAPIPDYPPMLFRYKGVLHTIARADGPERIEPEWWIRDGSHRDYYCVEDEAGRRYWIFREGHYTEERTEKWFLHGLFA